MREVTEFDEGDYSCIASTNRGLFSVRNFTISVSSTLQHTCSPSMNMIIYEYDHRYTSYYV